MSSLDIGNEEKIADNKFRKLFSDLSFFNLVLENEFY